MDDAKLTAMQNSLQEVREEVHQALARLDEDLLRMRITSRAVEIQMEAVRNTAFEALAEIRHIKGQLRDLASTASPAERATDP